MKKKLLAGIYLLATTGTLLAATPENSTESRGQLLYENHCTRCHDTSVHSRKPTRVKSRDELNHWIVNWAGVQKLGWNQNDIRDVSNYLNNEFYHLKK